MAIRFVVVTDREAHDQLMSFDGGDYNLWRIVAVENDTPIASLWRSSADFDFCGKCGMFHSQGVGQYDPYCVPWYKPDGWNETGVCVESGTELYDTLSLWLSMGLFAHKDQ